MLGRAHFNSPTVSSVHYYYLSSVALTDSRWSNVNLTVQYLILCLKLYTKDGAGAVDTVQVLNLLGNLLQLLHGVDAEPKNIASTLHRHNNLVNGHFTGLSAVLLQLGQWTFYRFAKCSVVTRLTAILRLCHCLFHRFDSCLVAIWSMAIWQFVCCPVAIWLIAIWQFVLMAIWQFVSCPVAIWSIAIWQFVTCPIATWLTVIWQAVK